MKSGLFLLGAGLVSLLAGCSSTPVALAPIGPNPARTPNLASQGELEVFSCLVGRSEGDNPTWHQHSNYTLYDAQGNMLERVDNTTGYYEQSPRQITLPAGRYLVKAQAKDHLWVNVPVTIVSGRTTRVHLDDNWQPAANPPQRELVSLPDGTPAGWRTGSAKAPGTN